MQVTRTTTWSDNQVLTATALNSEFNNLLNSANIVNADVSAGAAIVESKLLFSGSGHGHTGGTDGKLIASLSGTITGIYTLGGTPTFTNPTVNASIQAIQTYSPGAGGTATLDLSLANLNLITMPAGNITIALSNSVAGKVFVVRILQDGGGSRTVTWFSGIKWAGGVTPTLTTTASKADTFAFICTATNTYDGYIVGQNI